MTRTLATLACLVAAWSCADDPPVPTTMTVSPSTANLKSFEETVRLAATVYDQNGNALAGATIAWTTRDGAVATVDPEGLVTAKGNGTVSVWATSGQVADSAAVTVAQAVAVVDVSPSHDTLVAFGDTARMGAVAADANGHAVAGVEFSWSSGDTAVALVRQSGLVTSRSVGVAPVMAEAMGVKDTAQITVVPLVPTTLAVNPDSLGFSASGQTDTLVAEVRDQLGRVMDAGVSWSSTDRAVAVVSQAGVVTAGDNGKTDITAKAGKAAGKAVVSVRRVVASVTVSPAGDTITGGDTLRLAAEAFDSNGHRIDGVAFSWTSDQPAVATVESGLVAGTGEGTAGITARAHAASATARITVVSPDREVLAALFEKMGGPGWANKTNWLTEAPLEQWHGVQMSGYRVRRLKLNYNNLAGPIAPEIAGLDAMEELYLDGNRLPGAIPPEIGNLKSLIHITLWENQLTGEIPPEIGRLENLRSLELSRNRLTGRIPPEIGKLKRLAWFVVRSTEIGGALPPEIGNLESLEVLWLGNNRLTGPIPPEIGRLGKLRSLILEGNPLNTPLPPEIGNLKSLTELRLRYSQLTGPIPPEIGKLRNVVELHLNDNRLDGRIPPEFGDMEKLRRVRLQGNRLTRLPGEFGKLSKLEDAHLHGNRLAGEIPADLKGLESISFLLLHDNRLTGRLPPELGDLTTLQWLWLGGNDLSGPVPPEIGKMSGLQQLDLSDNAEMAGPLPDEMTELGELDVLLGGGTDLCAPPDDDFREWLERVYRRRLRPCSDPAVAYLTQAVQSRDFPVPMVGGERALLRLFLTADKENDEDIPDVTARFYAGGSEIHTKTIPGKEGPIPTGIDEGDLEKSVNAEIPANVIREGLEMVIEVDSVDADLGVARRVPEEGRLAVEVFDVPEFRLTLVPFLWTRDPDSTIIGLVEDVADDPEGHELLEMTRTLLPVAGMDIVAHTPVESSSNFPPTLLRQTQAIRIMEGRNGHYKGTMGSPTTGLLGVAYVPGRTSFSYPFGHVYAHELGHNMGLYHAPCGNVGDTDDPAYPYRDGSVGAWGWDFEDASLVDPSTPDLLSYCEPRWISDYHLGNMLRFRLSDDDNEELPYRDTPPSLLVWGGVSADGTPFLDPAFVVDAPASLPDSSGKYRVAGHTAAGTELFSLRFAMAEVADGGGESGFAFAVPAPEGWAGALASVTLSGPGGSATLDEETGNPMAILRNARTGEVTGFLRDLPTETLTREDAMAVVSPGPWTTLRFSRGVPGPDAWRR